MCYHLVSTFSFTETKAAEYAATMLKKNEDDGEMKLSAMVEL